MKATNIRIGTGFDIHQLVQGRRLYLGGVEIPHEKGLEGHSDADALIHAICDALLGALALGDIGTHFPNTDPQWKDAPSEVFLRECARLIRSEGWEIGNIDATILAERPKLAPHIKMIRTRLAAIAAVDIGQVSIKATTMEKLGAIGRGEGIAAMATVLLTNSG
jgi:2-C-methyl-D-erythritol 2,4-cyclodiphosphate synthase